MSDPKVSIVIPCYNYGKYVGEAVESCLKSTFQDIEIIIINDGSTDEYTLGVLDRLQYPKTTVIHQENKGLPAARNTGFQLAKAKYVLPLDADDLIHPTLIEKAFWLLELAPEAGFVSFWLKHFGDEDWVWMPPAFNKDRLLYENTVTVTSLVRKQAWESVGGYDENMRLGYEDWDFWISLAGAGWQGRQIPEPLFLYRKHGRTMINASREKHDMIVDQIRRKHPELYALNPSSAADKADKLFWSEERIYRYKKWSRRILPQRVDAWIRGKVKSWVKRNEKKTYIASLTDPNAVHDLPVSAYVSRPVNDNKVRLLFIVPWLEVGGADKVNLDLLSHLDKEKYDITLVTTLRSENPWFDKFNEVTPDIFILPNYKSNPMGYFDDLARLIETRSIQLIQISNSMEGFEMLPKLKERYASIPVIALVHNYVPEDPWDYARVSAQYHSFIDRYVAITSSLKTNMVDLIRVPAEKITVIENGVDTRRFYKDLLQNKIRSELKVGNNQRIVAFIGRMRFEKEPIKFVRIAEALAKLDADKKCIFLMVGDGEMFEEVQQKVRESQYSDRFRLVGARNDIPDILRETSIVISPSQREGLPVIGLEAMATGVPVIASKVTGWVDLISDGEDGFLIDFDNEMAFSIKANELLQNEDLYRAISNNAINIIEVRYTLSKFAGKYVDLYKNII